MQNLVQIDSSFSEAFIWMCFVYFEHNMPIICCETWLWLWLSWQCNFAWHQRFAVSIQSSANCYVEHFLLSSCIENIEKRVREWHDLKTFAVKLEIQLLRDTKRLDFVFPLDTNLHWTNLYINNCINWKTTCHSKIIFVSFPKKFSIENYFGYCALLPFADDIVSRKHEAILVSFLIKVSLSDA